MDYAEIKKLMDDMGESKLSEIKIEFPDGVKIKIKKDDKPKIQAIPMAYAQEIPASIPTSNCTALDRAETKKEVEGNVVKSPMVGTFYSKSSPTSEPFIKIGSKVKKGDTLCIIEAMKLMNEIESEFDGEVVEILVRDEEMVDYGKPLFIIK